LKKVRLIYNIEKHSKKIFSILYYNMNSKNKHHFEIDSDKIKQQAIKYIEKYINKENEIENYVSF
jgi:hypothetical protein